MGALPFDQCTHKLWRVAHPGVWECLECKTGTGAIYEKPYPRTLCIMPFCRRTSTCFPGEWICAEHWRLVSMRAKHLWAKVRRKWKRDLAAEASGSREYWIVDRRYRRLEARIWETMKREAIERATGI